MVMKEKEVIEDIKNRFGAELESTVLDEEEERFLQRRQEVEELYAWYFEAFVQHYQLIKEYGLEEKLLTNLAWKIRHLLSSEEIRELKYSNFHRNFGEYEIIKEALEERGDHE